MTTDVCVPLSKITEMVSDIKEDIEREGIVGPIVAHLGDGNAHALLLYRDDEEFAKVEGIVHRMVVKAQQLGGTCTGEHGIGLGKLVLRSPRVSLADSSGRNTWNRSLASAPSTCSEGSSRSSILRASWSVPPARRPVLNAPESWKVDPGEEVAAVHVRYVL